jgi:pimeloyl-ACP methyl ester carboxylesterase
MPTVALNGTDIHYELRGPADAPVVAFLNGVMMAVRSWVLQADGVP